MKLAPSIDLVWRLAASEMASGQFEEIEPEHFCIGLLKFAELPAAAVEADDKHAEIAKAIAADVELVCEALQKCRIESTSARRKLRGQLGKGHTPHHEGQIHRSAASRALFECAAKVALQSGSEVLTPLHLLTALLQSPTRAVAEAVLGKSAPLEPQGALPLLDQDGRDLVKEAAEGRLKGNLASEVQGKAVIRVLLRDARKSILLVSDDHDLTQGIAMSLALALAAKEPPAGLKGRRLIDISQLRFKWSQVLPEKEAEELKRLRGLLVEARSHPQIILLVPKIETDEKSPRGGQWTRLLRETVATRAVQFICGVTPTVFNEYLRKNPIWKRCAEAVWLKSTAVGSIPREL
jgi:ATP-dependent Clp protease ATP-binding subunit ClpA